jgi:hypothetical protein
VGARSLAAGALLAAGLAVAAGLALRQAGGSADLAALRARLDEERAARERLEAQLAQVAAQLSALLEDAAVIDEADADPYRERAGSPARGDDAPADAAAAAEGATGAAGPGSPRGAWFDQQRLAAAGLPERDVADLHQLFEEVELDRLYLQNQAAREAWPRGRLAAELAALDDRLLSVRERYGEDAYDWFLYAAGRSNRVKVEGVLGGSAAEDAGLRTGDVIVSYDGERIFKPGSLVQGTLGGRLGENIDVEVMRAGELVSLRLPRGPLGVRLGRDTVEPAPLP